MQLYILPLSFQANQTEHETIIQTEYFRIFKIYSNSKKDNSCFINGIYTGNAENQLLGSINTWELSIHLLEQLQYEFKKEHNLLNKSDKEIDKYLDDNELSMPKLMKLELPTLKKGDKLKFTGIFPEDTMFSITGYAP